MLTRMIKMAKRPKIGYIIEIATTRALAYAQLTHKHPMYRERL